MVFVKLKRSKLSVCCLEAADGIHSLFNWWCCSILLGQSLVHPKDKRNIGDNSKVVYSMCTSARWEENSKLVWKNTKMKSKRPQHNISPGHNARPLYRHKNKSAMTDHIDATNHTINLEESKILTKESHRIRRWTKESIYITKEKGPWTETWAFTTYPRLTIPWYGHPQPLGGPNKI